MNTKYGPTLIKEFIDAGVGGLPFSWNDETVVFDSSMTEEQRNTVLAVMAAHDPAATLSAVEENPVDKLKNFLVSNPDVAALL